MGSGGVANGYGSQMMEIGNAADFSYAFSTTTGFKVRRRSLAPHGINHQAVDVRMSDIHGDD